MNKLKELIDKLCPDGVQYKKLSELCIALKKGTLKTSDLKVNGKYPVINSGRELYGFYDEFNNKNAITFAARGEYAGFISYFEDEFWAGGLCYPYSSKDEKIITNKFLYYYLKSKEKIIMETLVARGSIPALNKTDLDRFMIAVPPLEVQCEIVHVLDDFTLLSAELSAELKARKKQYEYYKDELYSFKDKNVQYVKLKDIAEITRGGNFQKKDFVENGKPCIHYGQIYTRYGSSANSTFTYVSDEIFNKSKQAQPNDIVMAVTSENVEDVCKCVVWCGDENIAVSGHTAIIHHNINAKYLGYYFSTSHFYKDKTKLVHGTKVMEVTPSALNDVLIPVPDLKEQERIANLIENFDKLCNDITSGIPAEIEKRQEQYEYYRDKLLSFKEVEVYE
jgi:type I restriction enzyme S subunit